MMPEGNYKIILLKAQKFCTYQERSQQEMRHKLFEWKTTPQYTESIIADLVSHDFINEERFAIQLAGGKFRIKNWGKIKITKALKQHQISDYCIRKSLSKITNHEYRKCLHNILIKKSSGKLNLSPLELNKLVRFAYSKGFETELIWELLKEIQKENKSNCKK